MSLSSIPMIVSLCRGLAGNRWHFIYQLLQIYVQCLDTLKAIGHTKTDSNRIHCEIGVYPTRQPGLEQIPRLSQVVPGLLYFKAADGHRRDCVVIEINRHVAGLQ